MSLLEDMYDRLWANRRWIAAQFGGALLFILVGLAWTRLPDKHVWQVILSLLLPLLLIVSALELEACTVRGLFDDDEKRVKLVWGAFTLLVWVAIACAFWVFLDWCDDQIPLWAGYLNSKASAHARVSLFSYDHIARFLFVLEWLLRWVAMPAKMIPWGAASAQWGWRLPLRRILRLIWDWRWWGAVLAAALISVALPGRFFAGEPSGRVHAQVWHVILKLAVTYVLAMSCWVLLLCWAAVLFGREIPPKEEPLTEEPVQTVQPEPSISPQAELPPPDEVPPLDKSGTK